MKVLNMLSRVMNVVTLAAMIAVGAFHIQDARADAILSSVTEEDRYCLQQNIYFEARNQSLEGQVAVAWVTMNRVEAERYPNSICGVVWQDRQFSWTHDGLPDRPGRNVLEQRAWEDAGLIADVVLLDWAYGRISPVERATHYHADYVDPYWASSYTQVAVVDNHIFYQP
jgi:spore germination cell wall hydrolase CwlJ-like protein